MVACGVSEVARARRCRRNGPARVGVGWTTPGASHPASRAVSSDVAPAGGGTSRNHSRTSTERTARTELRLFREGARRRGEEGCRPRAGWPTRRRGGRPQHRCGTATSGCARQDGRCSQRASAGWQRRRCRGCPVSRVAASRGCSCGACTGVAAFTTGTIGVRCPSAVAAATSGACRDQRRRIGQDHAAGRRETAGGRLPDQLGDQVAAARLPVANRSAVRYSPFSRRRGDLVGG